MSNSPSSSKYSGGGSRSRSSAKSSSVVRSAVRSMAMDRMLWVFSAIAVVTAVVAILIARDHYNEVHSWSRIPNWLANPVLLGIIVTVCLLISANVTVQAMNNSMDDNVWRVTIPALFVGSCVLLLIIAYLVYRVHNFLGAFYLSIVTLVVLFIHGYGVSKMTSNVTMLGCLPLLLVVVTFVYLLWLMADESSDCVATSSPVFE